MRKLFIPVLLLVLGLLLGMNNIVLADDWKDFQTKLLDKLKLENNALTWSKSARVKFFQTNESTALIGLTAKKNYEIICEEVYVVYAKDFVAQKTDGEIAKALKAFQTYFAKVNKMEQDKLFLSDEQKNFVWSAQETALQSKFVAAAEAQFSDELVQRFLALEPHLNSPVSIMEYEDGQKWMFVGVQITNKWGIDEQFFVTHYPIAEINDQNVTEKAKDAVVKVEEYLKTRAQKK